MANIFKRLFGTEKKNTDYGGIRPASSLTQVMGGQKYYDTLENRLAGRDVGFGQGYADKYSSPIIQNMRSRFNSYDIPELNSELSATGRRRGSGGFDQIRRAYQEQGLNEGDVFSRLQQRDEDQRRMEINAALEGIGNFAQNEANMRDNSAQFEYNDNLRHVNEAAVRRQADSQGIGKALSAGVMLAAAPFTGGASLMSLPSTFGGPNIQGFNLPGASSGGYGKSGLNRDQRLANRARYAQTGRVG